MSGAEAQLLERVGQAYFEWQSLASIEPRLIDFLASRSLEAVDQFQVHLIQRLLEPEWARRFPVWPKHRRNFLKRLILLLETTGCEVREILYQAMHVPPAASAAGVAHKSYFHEGSYLMSLVENDDLVCQGTTGLHTWEAGRFLLAWLHSRPEVMRDSKSALELGSGMGYTGIGLLKLGTFDHLVMTDCHPLVLDSLRANCEQNLAHCPQAWSVRPLDWSTFDSERAQACPTVDTVLAADVVFDPVLIADLVRTLKLLLGTCAPSALVACTPRNATTLKLFQELLRDAHLTYHHPGIGIDNPNDIRLFHITQQ